MELLERSPLLVELDAHLSRATSGAGSVTLVSGEAGVGKTSLVDELCRAHRHDARIFRGGCEPLGAPRPLGPVHEIALQAGGELASVMASGSSRHERFSALLDLLRAPGAPSLLVIEDIHWADEVTLDLLLFLARRVASTTVLVVVTLRDAEADTGPRLREVLGHLVVLPRVNRVRVLPLSLTAVRQLCKGTGRDPETLHRTTGGNAFFVTEVLGSQEDDEVPGSVRDAVLGRVARLSPSARELIEAAAVVPDRAELALLLDMSGGHPRDVDECERAGLLRCDPRGVTFRHELARRAVEQAVPGARARALHRSVVGFLADVPGRHEARISYHADLAGDVPALVRFAPRAAAQAAALGAHREAAVHLDRVLAHADGIEPETVAALLSRSADENLQLNRLDLALAASSGSVRLWRELGDSDRHAAQLARLARLQWTMGRGAEARQTADAALAIAETLPGSHGHAVACTYDSLLRMLAREIPEAVRVGERAIELTRAHGDLRLLAIALVAVGSASWFVDPDRAERLLLESLRTAQACDDDVAASSAMVNLGSGAGEIRRYDVAERWLQRCFAWCSERDLDANRDYARAWLARVAGDRGRWDEARALADDVRESHSVISRIVATTTLGVVGARRGDRGTHEPLSQAWELAVGTQDLQRLWPAAAARAEAASLAGTVDESTRKALHGTYELAVRRGHAWAAGELGYRLWRLGELETVAEVAAPTPYAAQVAGDARAAAAAWAALGCPYEAAVARSESDDVAELTEALTGFRELGARPAAELTVARLRALGVRRVPRGPRRTTQSNPWGLTERELEVLDLLTEGHTNPEVAARLHISARTAEHHVTAILAKLEVTSRRQAAERARAWHTTGQPPATR